MPYRHWEKGLKAFQCALAITGSIESAGFLLTVREVLPA